MKVYKLSIDLKSGHDFTRGIAAKSIEEAFELGNKYYCGAITAIEQIRCLTTEKEYEMAIFVF